MTGFQACVPGQKAESRLDEFTLELPRGVIVARSSGERVAVLEPRWRFEGPRAPPTQGARRFRGGTERAVPKHHGPAALEAVGAESGSRQGKQLASAACPAYKHAASRGEKRRTAISSQNWGPESR